MENQDIKVYAKKHGVKMWELAVRLGISEATITRWLRVPLSAERERLLYRAAKELTAEREEA